jgi:CheY-like chemotaxis protein
VGAAGYTVTAEAPDGTEALGLVDQLDPAVVVLGEKLSGMGGLETARRILERRPHQTIVLFSAYLALNHDVEEAAHQLGIATLAKMEYRHMGAVIEAALTAQRLRRYIGPPPARDARDETGTIA